MGVGLRLKELLRDRKITIKQLSEDANIPINTLYSITKRDSERVDSVILQRIADTLGVSADYLLGQYHLKGIIDYKSADIRQRIFTGIEQAGLSNEEFCKALGMPIDEWFKWKEASSESYLEHLPEIAELLNIPENELSRGYKRDVPNASRLKNAFSKLNYKGQQKAVEAVEIIAGNPEYQLHPKAAEAATEPPEGKK